MTVTKTRDMTVTQTTDMTVTETRDMPVTQTTDMTVTETTDMPVTEGTLSADREREAACDEERDSLTSVDSNVTNDLTNKAPCDSHDLDFDQSLKKPETTESQLHDAVSNKMKDTSAPRLQDKLHWEHGTGATQAHDTPDEQTVELASISTGRYEYAKHEKAVDTHSPKEDTTTDSADTATNDTKCSGSDGTAASDRKCSQSKDTIAKNRQLPSRLPMVTAKEEETTKPSDGKGRKVSQRKARVASGRRPRQTATTDRDMIPTSTATGLDESQGVTKRQQKPWQDEGHKQATTEPRQPDEREDEPRIDHVTGQHLSATCTPFSGASSTGNATNGASKGRKDTRHEGTNENSAQGGTSTGRKRSKEGHDMGDLNNLSDNDNTDANSDLAGNAVNMSPSGGTRETKDVRKVCEDKGLEDTTTGKEPRSRRPRTSHVILEVQASVQRFESERRSIRALQQVRRAHMTNTLAHDLKLFRSLLLVGGSKHHKDTRFKTEGKKSRPSPIPKKLDKRKQLRCNGWNLQRRRSEVEEDIDKDMEEDSADLCPDPSTTPASPKHRGDTRVRPPSRIENHSETSKELSPRLLLREWQQEHHMKVQRSLVLAYSHHVSHQALPAIYHSGKQRSSYQSSQTNTSRPSRPSTTKSLWVSRSHSDSPMSTTRTDNLTSGTVSMNKGLTSGPNGVSRAQLSFIRRASSLVTSYGASHLYLDPITTQSCEHS
ncbi:uncharacterized protein LOC112570988 [Pomacea canaliculata]|uniref:uncharacterized protein LOC112570988 n=1 Tax=Pomacea canaliculata TaxID=400727 RepID=UPI000D728C62|nr:uncharacterized protein LOC112570988 [Pomacea canaliculata]